MPRRRLVGVGNLEEATIACEPETKKSLESRASDSSNLSQSPRHRRLFLHKKFGGGGGGKFKWIVFQLFPGSAGILCLATVLLFFWNLHTREWLMMPSSSSSSLTKILPVVLPARYPIVRFAPSGPLADKDNLSNIPDFAGIEYFTIVREKVFARSISDIDDTIYHKERLTGLQHLDEIKNNRDYVSKTDPDIYNHYDEIDYPNDSGCYRPAWSFRVYPSCNTFHEQSLDRAVGTADQSLNVKYVGRGQFREGWVAVEAKERYDFVLKTIRYREMETVTPNSYSQTQMEAIAMLQTSNSNRTTAIYGHCSTSVMVERGESIELSVLPAYFFLDQKWLDQEQLNDVKPRNMFTPEQKLQMALYMAEGLAELHGNPGGVIVNHDVSLDQWVQGKDGAIKLNDFNKAIILKWNPEEERYCTFPTYQAGRLVYYPPEDLKGGQTDESADVYSLAKILYMLLTGLIPHYELPSKTAAVEAIIAGAEPFIDPRYRTRSFIEGRLVEAMETCWKYELNDRPSIFWLVNHLRETARLSKSSSLTGNADISQKKE